MARIVKTLERPLQSIPGTLLKIKEEQKERDEYVDDIIEKKQEQGELIDSLLTVVEELQHLATTNGGQLDQQLYYSESSSNTSRKNRKNKRNKRKSKRKNRKKYDELSDSSSDDEKIYSQMKTAHKKH